MDLKIFLIKIVSRLNEQMRKTLSSNEMIKLENSIESYFSSFYLPDDEWSNSIYEYIHSCYFETENKNKWKSDSDLRPFFIRINE